MAQDSASDWYVVPVENRKEWEAWTNNEAAWIVPVYARRLSGNLASVTFTDPQGIFWLD